MNANGQQSKIEPLSVWSLVLGILGLCCLGPLASVPAVICGHVARSRLQNAVSSATGAGLALAGIIMGYIGMAGFVLVVILGITFGPAWFFMSERPEPMVPGEVIAEVPRVRTLVLEFREEGDPQAGFDFSRREHASYRHAGDADLVLHYENDCPSGAIFGYDDGFRLVYPLGPMDWDQIDMLSSVPNVEPVYTITPVTPGREGQAFLLRCESGKYVAIRFTKVHAITLADLENGRVGHVEMEWREF